MKRVALVTGGTRGIGFGIAIQLASNGFDLAVNGIRSMSDVREPISKLTDFGNDVIYCQGNISSSTDREKIIQQVKEHFGRLDILVNNAGIAPKERKDILDEQKVFCQKNLVE